MSEIIKIDESNCVLSELELDTILCSLDFYTRNLMKEKSFTIYRKVKKLNDLAKEQLEC